LTLIQAVVPSADEVVTQGDVHEEIDLLCNLNVEDLKISTLLASTREHPLVFGGVTGIIADALERRDDVIVRSSPIGRMSKACIDVVPCTLTTHKVPLASAWHSCERSGCGIVGEPEKLMEESKIIRRRDELSCARIAIA
jgi:hypothetical protein